MAEMNRVSRLLVNTFSARRNARIFDWLARNLSLPAGAECLELGCGNGDMAARIVDGLRPARYVATDLDPRQLESAKRHLATRYPRAIPALLELRAADMLHLPFADTSFDAVFAFVAIHHASPNHHDFTNVPHALEEIDRVLRPRGTLVYEEFVHKAQIRAWLVGRGYLLAATSYGWRRETVVAMKAGGIRPELTGSRDRGADPTI
jgi:ubiquinone/menaquinone biosynthesis C-methylase UbiE